jgi:uncharacterized membrane protein
MHSTRIQTLIFLVLLLLPFGYAIYLYPHAPARIPIHFNISGEPDGWGDRDSLFIGPLILGAVGIFVYFLISNVKRIDPRRYGDEDDRIFKKGAFLTQAFLCCLSLLILYSSMHPEAPLQKILFAFFGLVLSAFGLYMSKLKQNYIAGFKLPWTLASEANWKSTHQLAGKIWFVGGLLLLLASLLFEGAWLSGLFIVILAVLLSWPCIHSYQYFRKEIRSN